MFAQIDWASVLAAAGVTWLVQCLLHPLAPRLNLIDYPKGRKSHAHPTPITGGLAMLVGVVVVSLPMLKQLEAPTVAFLVASTLLVVVGLLDDRFDLPWTVRIPAHVAAALIMVYVGGVRVEQLGPAFGMSDFTLGWLSVPFTVFATVGLINAINMIDGADGLAGSLVFTALLLLTAAAMYAGNLVIASRSLILAGVVAAFLSYNLRFPWRPKAKIFMGNAGSAFLGFVIAWFAFRLTQNPSHPINPVLALWVVAIPVMDCLVLMLRRMRNRRSPFIADRNHMHHMMLEAGFGPTQAALLLSAVTALGALVVGQAMRWDVPHPVLLGAYFVLCGGWYWLTARRERAVNLFRHVHAAWPLGRPGRKPEPSDVHGSCKNPAP